jgi:hypothetical protein
MKYYVYVSDTKLDMLYAQIPQNILKKISADLGINLGFVSLSLKEKKDDFQGQETARYKKLEVVTNYIKKNFPVGSIDSPKEYFEGTIQMRWGDYMDTGMVYFGGNTDQTWLGLAGSSYHVIGFGSAGYGGQVKGSVSVAIRIEPALKKAIGHDPKLDRNINSKWHSHTNPDEVGNASFLRLVVRLTSAMRGPKEKFEFLARKLNYGKLTSSPTEKTRHYDSGEERPYNIGENVLLGTPIYVAQVADDESSAQ